MKKLHWNVPALLLCAALCLLLLMSCTGGKGSAEGGPSAGASQTATQAPEGGETDTGTGSSNDLPILWE